MLLSQSVPSHGQHAEAVRHLAKVADKSIAEQQDRPAIEAIRLGIVLMQEMDMIAPEKDPRGPLSVWRSVLWTIQRLSSPGQEGAFSDQVRYNWGFHDAAHAVARGWDNTANNYGFASYGPLAGVSPENLAQKHFDHLYVAGWHAGFRLARHGKSTASSLASWMQFLALTDRH